MTIHIDPSGRRAVRPDDLDPATARQLAGLRRRRPGGKAPRTAVSEPTPAATGEAGSGDHPATSNPSGTLTGRQLADREWSRTLAAYHGDGAAAIYTRQREEGTPDE